jgi:hypothetical protein
MWAFWLASEVAHAETMTVAPADLAAAIETVHVRAGEPIAVVVANTPTERAVREHVELPDLMFLRAGSPSESGHALASAGIRCGAFLMRENPFGQARWALTVVGPCASPEPATTAIEAPPRQATSLPPPRAFASGTLFTYGGYVEAGPGVGVGVSGDAGVSWVLHVHAEVGMGFTGPTISDAPDGVIHVGRLGLEAAYPFALRRHGVLGPAIAVDARFPGSKCEDDYGCALPGPGAAMGIALITHPASEKLETFNAFIGLGGFLVYDFFAAGPRIRLAWTRASHVYYGFELSTPVDVMGMVGVQL